MAEKIALSPKPDIRTDSHSSYGEDSAKVRWRVAAKKCVLFCKFPLKLNIVFNFEIKKNSQGSKGIRLWLTNWCTSPMLIHKITPYVGAWNVWTLNLINQPFKIH